MDDFDLFGRKKDSLTNKYGALRTGLLKKALRVYLHNAREQINDEEANLLAAVSALKKEAEIIERKQQFEIDWYGGNE